MADEPKNTEVVDQLEQDATAASEDNKTAGSAIERVKEALDKELEVQKQARAAIKEQQQKLNTLRTEKRVIAEQRAEFEAQLRELRGNIREKKRTARSKDTSDEEKESLRADIEDEEKIAADLSKTVDAKSIEGAQKSVEVQYGLGAREEKQNIIRDSRETTSELQSRVKMVEAADSLTPKALRNEMAKKIEPDQELEGLQVEDKIVVLVVLKVSKKKRRKQIKSLLL
jgi:hypothetical protein